MSILRRFSNHLFNLFVPICYIGQQNYIFYFQLSIQNDVRSNFLASKVKLKVEGLRKIIIQEG